MPIEYLKTTSEEAYKVLDRIAVEGFRLRAQMIDENNMSHGNPDNEQINRWKESYGEWYKRSTAYLKDIYHSERQSLTFQHKSGIEMFVPGRHAICSDLVVKIDVKMELIEEYIKLLENHFKIIFHAERDNNIQVGGSNNNQQIKN